MTSRCGDWWIWVCIPQRLPNIKMYLATVVVILVSRAILRCLQPLRGTLWQGYLFSNNDTVTVYTDIINRLENPVALVHGEKGYIYSAVLQEKQNSAILSGWYKRRPYGLDYCCSMLSNGHIQRDVARLREKYKKVPEYKKSPDHFYDAVQFECKLPVTTDDILGIGISSHAQKCTDRKKYYTKLFRVPKNITRKFGMCVKYMYGSVDAKDLVEWVEAQKYLGVDYILVQLVRSGVSKDILQVLGYYTHTGLVETVVFELPDNGTFPRSFQTSFPPECKVDAKVARLNCEERLASFQYAVMLDTDEFILPEIQSDFQGSLRKLVEKELDNNTDSGVQFMTRMHMLAWEPAHRTHPLLIGRFLNSTDAWWDRWKCVYVPERVKPGSCEDHYYIAEDGYHEVRSVGSETASIHHYRSCRAEWNIPSYVAVRMNASHVRWNPLTVYARYLPSVSVQNGTLCQDFTQFEDTTMKNFITEIETNVLHVSHKLGLI